MFSSGKFVFRAKEIHSRPRYRQRTSLLARRAALARMLAPVAVVPLTNGARGGADVQLLGGYRARQRWRIDLAALDSRHDVVNHGHGTNFA